MSNSRAEVGNTQDEPGASYRTRKYGITPKKKKTHHTLLATYQRALGQLKSSQWPKMEQSEQQNSTVYWIRVIVV